MLILPQAVLACGLMQLLTFNQTVSIHDMLVFARVSAAATVATHVSQVFLSVFQAHNMDVDLFELPEAPFRFDIVSNTDLVLYAAPLGVYAWEANPSIREYAYQAFDLVHYTVSRVYGALSELLPDPGLYLDRLGIGHSPASSPYFLAPGRNRNTSTSSTNPNGLSFGPLFKFLGGQAIPTIPVVIKAPPLGPNMSSLSGVGWCGVGTQPRPVIPPNTSIRSYPGYCGLGTESLERVASNKFEFINLSWPDMPTVCACLTTFALGYFCFMGLKLIVMLFLGFCLLLYIIVSKFWSVASGCMLSSGVNTEQPEEPNQPVATPAALPTEWLESKVVKDKKCPTPSVIPDSVEIQDVSPHDGALVEATESFVLVENVEVDIPSTVTPIIEEVAMAEVTSVEATVADTILEEPTTLVPALVAEDILEPAIIEDNSLELAPVQATVADTILEEPTTLVPVLVAGDILEPAIIEENSLELAPIQATTVDSVPTIPHLVEPVVDELGPFRAPTDTAAIAASIKATATKLAPVECAPIKPARVSPFWNSSAAAPIAAVPFKTVAVESTPMESTLVVSAPTKPALVEPVVDKRSPFWDPPSDTAVIGAPALVNPTEPSASKGAEDKDSNLDWCELIVKSMHSPVENLGPKLDKARLRESERILDTKEQAKSNPKSKSKSKKPKKSGWLDEEKSKPGSWLRL